MTQIRNEGGENQANPCSPDGAPTSSEPYREAGPRHYGRRPTPPRASTTRRPDVAREINQGCGAAFAAATSSSKLVEPKPLWVFEGSPRQGPILSFASNYNPMTPVASSRQAGTHNER